MLFYPVRGLTPYLGNLISMQMIKLFKLSFFSFILFAAKKYAKSFDFCEGILSLRGLEEYSFLRRSSPLNLIQGLARC